MTKPSPPANSRLAFGALYALMVVYIGINVPIYLWYLHTASRRWATALPPGDSTRTLLPIAIPLAAFSFLLLAALSWWFTHAHDRPFLLGRTGGRFLIPFIAALSMTAGILGSTQHDFETVLFTAMVTFLGMTGLWLLPAVLSPRLLKHVPRNNQSATPPDGPSPTARSSQS